MVLGRDNSPGCVVSHACRRGATPSKSQPLLLWEAMSS